MILFAHHTKSYLGIGIEINDRPFPTRIRGLRAEQTGYRNSGMGVAANFRTVVCLSSGLRRLSNHPFPGSRYSPKTSITYA